MGLIDTVYVSQDVATAFDLRCSPCGQAPPQDSGWQTKSLDPCMSSYALRRLRRRGEGHFLPEAFLPQNRRQRFMGELPHQWIEIYVSCECGSLIERWIKFSDGVAVECRAAPPRHEPGLFDDAVEFGL